TFPLVTGQEDLFDSGVQTLDGIRMIKEGLPGVLTVLGVSNVSFGLGQAARAVLNSVFLYHAVKHGLDLAIVNPSHITPYADVPNDERELAEELIYNRRPDALARYIQHFEAKAPEAAAGQPPVAPYEGLSAEQRLHDPGQQRLHGLRPRQAGPDQHDHREGAGGRRDRDRAVGALGLDLQADAALRPGVPPARARVPGPDRRGRDQPRLRLPGALRR